MSRLLQSHFETLNPGNGCWERWGRSHGGGGATAGEGPWLDLKILGGSWWELQVQKELPLSHSQLLLPGHTGSLTATFQVPKPSSLATPS